MTRPPLKFVGWELDRDGFASPHVQVGMEFFPVVGEHPFRKRSNRKPLKARLSEKDDPGDASLIALNWSKSMGTPSGTWQVVLRARPSLNDAFAEHLVDGGDWVIITVYRNGTPLPLCLGRIDTIKEGKAVAGGGAVPRVWTLTGRDHGSCFEYPISYTTLFARQLRELVNGPMAHQLNFKVGGTPDDLFQTIIKGTFGSGTETGQWVLPATLTRAIAQKAPPQRGLDDLDVEAPADQTAALDREGRRFGDLLKAVTILPSWDPLSSFSLGLRGKIFQPNALWNQGGQTLHETLTQWCNPLLNEFWYDLLPPAGQVSGLPHGMQDLEGGGPRGRPGAIIRERPFVSTELGTYSPWFHLPTWKIPRWITDNVEMARSDAERKNLFNITLAMGGLNHDEFAAIERPLWDKDDIRRNGLRIFDQSTGFIHGASRSDWMEGRRSWIRLLADWWAPSPYLRSGTLSSRAMLPEVRVGNRVILTSGNPQTDEQAYVQAVNLSYSAPPSANAGRRSITTLTLTRGFVGTDQQLLNATKALSARFKEVDRDQGI